MDAGRNHYDDLDAYTSYSLAWLAPIVYPLTLAIIAQGFVLTDIFYSNSGRRFLPQLSFLSKAGDNFQTKSSSSIPRMDPRLNLAALVIMLSEIIFALCCIVQCSINYSNRAFVGTSTACDVQAIYATYYVFSAIGLAVFGIILGWRVISVGDKAVMLKASSICVAAVLIHAAALFIALLPFFGLDGWMFANDYCMFDIEGPLYCTLFLVVYFSAGLCISLALVQTRSVVATAPTGSAAPKRIAYRLLAGTSFYLFIAWILTVVIAFLWIAKGEVYDSSLWRIYGAQAIILHSNQLVTPLLFGWFWRHVMQAVLLSSEVDSAEPA